MGNIKISTLCACLIALIFVENKPCTKSSYDRHPGIQLQGHVIKKMTTSDWGNCVIECGKTPGCLSINSHNAGNVISCELNKSNRHGSPSNLIKTSLDWEYLEMVLNPDWPDACLQKDGWYRSRSAAYKFVNVPATVQVARQRCHALSAGADLVSFANKEEEQIFNQYLEGFAKVSFWIGFNDIAEEGTYVWFDGTKSNYTNWYSGEPSNARVDEDCTLKITKMERNWADQVCTDAYPFACKVSCT